MREVQLATPRTTSHETRDTRDKRQPTQIKRLEFQQLTAAHQPAGSSASASAAAAPQAAGLEKREKLKNLARWPAGRWPLVLVLGSCRL
jgi:hypothetical protein